MTDDAYLYPFIALLSVVAGVGIGWVYAHGAVATECDRLGAFYIGDRVYECKRRVTHPSGETK